MSTGDPSSVAAERHARVRELFLAACQQSAADLEPFLSEECGDDKELRREIESLLSHHEEGSDERPSGATQPTIAEGSASDTRPGRRARTRFEAGDVFAGRYRIVAELGRGGMGEVFRAQDLMLDETVAIKLLTRELAQERRLQQGRSTGRAQLTVLLNEVRMARQVTHPNVCRMFDFGEAEGEVFLTMEYVDGEDLGSLLARIGRFPRDKLLDVAYQLTSGLAAAHECGVLHRDLKPGNVLIDGRGQVKITDFGVATDRSERGGLLPASAIAGTPAYMAPEQATRGEVSVQSDLYSLGLVLHEMATGRPVFEAETPAGYAELHRASTPAPPSQQVRYLDPELESVILQCLEKDPENRPSSARAMAAALPGGDRLRRALEAGETPSPEMVAAADRGQALAPGSAAALLVTLFLILSGLWVLGDRAYPGRAAWADRSPEVLADRAATLIHQLGYEAEPTDRAWGLWPDYGGAYEKTGVFWYRQAPDHLRPSYLSALYFPRTDFDDPPPSHEGIRLMLDPEGQLLMLSVTPASDAESESDEVGVEAAAGPVETDWSPVLQAAGFDLAALQAAEPKVSPPVFADQRAAWTIAGRSRPIEAAANRGRVVYFDAQKSDPEEKAIDFSGLWSLYVTLSQVFWLILATAAIVLAWNNLKHRRGDLHGAGRLAGVVVVLNLGAWLLEADHVPDLTIEAFRFEATFGRILLDTVVAWLAYIALEPTVRRWWPQALIAWSRLLRGRPTDPLVGRALLTGTVVGAAWALLTLIDRLATRWFGFESAGEIFDLPQLELALAGRLMFAEVLSSLVEAASRGVLDLFFLVGLRIVLKRWWLAIALFVFANGLLETLEGIHPAVSWLTLGLGIAGVTALILMRWGLLTYAVALFSYLILVTAPITLSMDAWFADTGLFVMALVAGLGIFGFWTSIAGRPLTPDFYLAAGEST